MQNDNHLSGGQTWTVYNGETAAAAVGADGRGKKVEGGGEWRGQKAPNFRGFPKKRTRGYLHLKETPS